MNKKVLDTNILSDKEKQEWSKHFGLPIQENVFSEKDIENLISIMFKKHTSLKRKESGTIFFMFKDEDIIPYLEKLDIWNKDLKLDGNFYLSPHPYLPHIDSTSPDMNPKGYVPYKTVLIPLMGEPKRQDYEGKFSLICMSERYLGYGTNFTKHIELITDTWKTDHNYNDDTFFKFTEGDSITEEFLKKNLNFLNKDTVKDFHIEKILPWKIGSAMIFDSCQVHVSVDHEPHGGKYKSGLNVTLYRPV